MSKEDNLKQTLKEEDDIVKWVVTGLELAKKNGKTLETMIDTFRIAWYMAAILESCKLGDKDGE